MNRFSSANYYPSVQPITAIFILTSFISINFWPIINITANAISSNATKNIQNYGIQYIPEVNDYQKRTDRSLDHSTENIQISNSQCPNFCECEHVIWNNDITDGSQMEISVYCHEGGLEQIAFSKLLKQIPKEVTVLDVEAPLEQPNHLLWDDNLNQLKHLRVLRLINCAIPAISRALKLRSLEILDLRGNHIQHLPVSIFSGVPFIRELNLAKNLLSVLPTGAFAYLKNLQILSLAYNNITEITVNLLRDLKNLKSLHLDGNHISVTQLNSLFTDIPQLERLELNECGLSMGAINDLALNKFHSLYQLGIARNMLGKVPINALRNHLSSLITLDLSDNELIEIESEIFAKTNITQLLLAGNHLGTNPNALSINSFKTGIALRELDLSRNNFDHFHSNYLGIAQETVEILHLNENHITSIEQSLIANMTKLKILHLGYNFIEYLPQQLPNEFAQLLILNLTGNQLTTLLDYSKEILPMLRMIDISKNRFTTFPVTVIQNFFNNLDKVDLHGNPLDCTCYVEELKRHMLDRYAYRRELRYEQTSCVTPEHFHGIPIYRLNHVADCTFLFGARYGLSQLSEIAILFLFLIIFALSTALLILFAYNRLERRQKKKYTDVKQSQSRIALTLSQHLSNSPTSLTEPLTPPPESPISGISSKMPPPPPPILTNI
ncbi:Leucine rich repeat family protein [Brugia pahangi]